MQGPNCLCRITLLLVIVVAATQCLPTIGLAQGPDASQSTPPNQAQQTDRYGDPLPIGVKVRLGTVRLRQNGHSVAGVAFSPDGKFLVSCGWEDSIRFWDVGTGRLVRRLVNESDEEGTLAAAFSPDGTKLASAGMRGHVQLWDLETGNLISKALGHVERTFGEGVFGVGFSPDGLSYATAGADKSVRLWDSATGTQLLGLQGDEGGGNARPVAFSPDGTLLASGNESGAIQIWNLAEGGNARIIPDAHPNRVRPNDVVSLVFTRDGKHLISSGSQYERTGQQSGRSISKIYVWDVGNGEKQPGFDAGEESLGGCTIAISGDGNLLASAHREKIVIWDVKTRVAIRTIRGDEDYGGRTHGLAISPDNRLVAAGTYSPGSNKLYLWNLATGESVLPQSDSHVHAVLATDASPAGSHIVTGSADGTVRLWNAATGEHVRMIDKGSGWVRYVEFFPDGQLLALGRETYQKSQPNFEGEVKICRIGSGEVVHHFPVADRVMCGTLSSDGKQLAVGVGLGERFGFEPGAGPPKCKIHVWDTNSGQQLSDITGTKNQFYELQFTADDRELWSTSDDQIVRKWSVQASKEVQSNNLGPEGGQIRQFRWLRFVPGTTRVAIRGLERIDRGISHGKLTVVEFESNKAVWEKTFVESWPREFSVSRDGKLVAAFMYPLTGSKAHKRIAVFSADSGEELLSFDLEDGTVRSLAFSSDGNSLMSGMEASDVLVWNISSARD